MLNNLTQADVRKIFDYDAENGILIKKFKSGKRSPCGHTPILNGYGKVGIGESEYLSHRIIWLWYYGEWPSGLIDHRDGNRINNRIENLRIAGQEMNAQNSKLYNTNTSGFRGVSWYPPRGKYRVYITVGYRRKHIGYYPSFEDAVLAAMLAKIEYHPTSPISEEYLQELTYAG